MFCLYRYRFWYFVSRFWYVVLKKTSRLVNFIYSESNEFSYWWLYWNWLCSLHSVHHETPGFNRVITPVIFSGGHPHHVPKPDMLISYQKPPLLQDVSLENLDQSPRNSTQLKRRRKSLKIREVPFVTPGSCCFARDQGMNIYLLLSLVCGLIHEI